MLPKFRPVSYVATLGLLVSCKPLVMTGVYELAAGPQSRSRIIINQVSPNTITFRHDLIPESGQVPSAGENELVVVGGRYFFRPRYDKSQRCEFELVFHSKSVEILPNPKKPNCNERPYSYLHPGEYKLTSRTLPTWQE